jgi:hypothetical protein
MEHPFVSRLLLLESNNRAAAVRGPKILQEAWDPKKTVRQKCACPSTDNLRFVCLRNYTYSYAAMGLLDNLNPTTSGGVERRIGAGVNDTSSSSKMFEDDSIEQSGSSPEVATLRKGLGRIIRDADGNVVDVELEEEEKKDTREEPRLAVVDNEEEWRGISQESAWVKALRSKSTEHEGQSEVVQREFTFGAPILLCPHCHSMRDTCCCVENLRMATGVITLFHRGV